MATKTVVCPECAQSVPPGRFACPECGALVASVAAGPRAAWSAPGVEVAEQPAAAATGLEPADGVEPGVAALDDVQPGDGVAATDGTDPGDEARAAHDAEPVDEAGREDWLESGDEGAGDDSLTAESVTAWMDASTPGDPRDSSVQDANPSGIPSVLREWPPRAALPAPDEPQWPSAAHPSWSPPADPGWPPSPAERARAAYELSEAPLHPEEVPATPVAPSPAPATAGFGAVPAVAAGPSAPAATSASGSVAAHFVPAGAYLPPSAVFAPETGPSPDRPRAGRAGLFADLPFEAPDDLPSWFVSAGSAVAAGGFILPWARAVIGADGVGSYLDSWGLGAPMHLPVFLFALAVLALAVLPNRLAPWLAGILLPLLLGGLLLGLAWPYVVGPLGAQLGAWAEVVGAVLLVVGGSLAAARPERHAGDDPGV